MRLALLLAVLGSAPLAALEQTQLYGTWAIDQEALWETMKARPEFAKVPAEQQAMMKTMFTQQLGKVSLTWNAEGGTMGTPQGKQEVIPPSHFTSTGPMTATITGNKPNQKAQLELKGETLIFTDLDPKAAKTMPSMTFKRAPAAK